jgi:hypothetical protein
MRAWRTRWPFWAAYAAVAVLIALVWLPGAWPWPLQFAAAVALLAQQLLISQLMSARAKWSHAWLRGYFAALDDVSCPESDEPS